eukprot:jgi/Phyca11/19680/fgenesh1_pg.PHYCAscaffold_51_\
MKSTLVECATHPGRNACTTTLTTSAAAESPASPPPVGARDTPMADAGEERLADVDDGEVYAAMRLGPGEVPERRPRLRLRQLSDEELEAASEMVERLGAALSAKITDAEDWASAEGYITALPYMLYDKLQSYSQAPPIAKARRRVGRIRSAINQQLLRHKFDTDEKACVDGILSTARAERAARAATPSPPASGAPTTTVSAPGAIVTNDDGTCPIPSDKLWRHFDAVNTPRLDFDAEAPGSEAFRAAMDHLPAATRFLDLLKEAPSTDEILRLP